MVTWTVTIAIRGICIHIEDVFVIGGFLSFGSCEEAHLVPLLPYMLRSDSIAPVRIKLSMDIASRSTMRNLVWVILLVAAARAQQTCK